MEVKLLPPNPPEVKINLSGSHQTLAKEHYLFSQSCRGLRFQNVTLTSKYYCYYHTTNPFTKIGPFKVEIMNFNPLISIYYDVLTDEEMEFLKTTQREKFVRSGIFKNEPTDRRIAMAKVIDDNEITDRITRRVGDMHGLNMKSDQRFKIQNYGIGGHFDCHFDFVYGNHSFDNGLGNRISTTLFYVSWGTFWCGSF